jgi:glycosyltransferase involved in cell wall biosynthesis
MKIAIATRHIHRAGGVETYLEHVAPALIARGHDTRVWYEFAPDEGAERIVPATVHASHLRCTDAARGALDEVAAWKPDAIFLHGLSKPAVEEHLIDIAPTVLFLHAYHGTCISGTKTHLYPTAAPCSRTLGPGCLLHYYPRRCGGWHPVSMITNYRQQRRRQTLLGRAAFVTTLSEHMRQEAIAHGVEASRAIQLPAFTPPAPRGIASPERRAATDRWHLLFAGRMETLKGGHVLLDALSQLDDGLRRRLRVTFAGDGRERSRLERRAARLIQSGIDVRFANWLSPSDRTVLFQNVDLLVVPSVWPEPFGLVGLEAAASGVPAVAFDVGGIREWLIDGVTGRLVDAPPISGAALARAIADCLSDPDRLRAWGGAALTASRTRTLAGHVNALENVLVRAAGQPAAELELEHA